MTTDNQEIQRTVTTSNDVLLQKFYETQNSRTTSSIDSYGYDILFMNFKYKIKQSDYLLIPEIEKELSNQIGVTKINLPSYFNQNKSKINNLYKNIKLNKNLNEIVDSNFNLLRDCISELNFVDVNLELTKTKLIKITTIFKNNKILIISKDFEDNDSNIIYSYFINRTLIASDVAEIKDFTEKFNKYLSL